MKKLIICLIFVTQISIAANLEVKLMTDQESYKKFNQTQDLIESENRKVYFADTKDWSLYHKNGVVLRLREKKGKIKSTVKLRGLTAKEFSFLQSQARNYQGGGHKFKCEIDQVVFQSEKLSCSVSKKLKGTVSTNPKRFFSAVQMNFLASHLKVEISEIEKQIGMTTIHGPIQSIAKVHKVRGIASYSEADSTKWTYQGKSIFEISTKASSNSNVLEDFKRMINELSLYNSKGSTKTKWAVDNL